MEKTKNMTHEEALRVAEAELGIDEKTEAEIKMGINEDEQVQLSNGTIVQFNTDIITGRMIIELKDRYFEVRKRKAGIIADLDDYFFVMVAEKMTGIAFKEFMDLKAKDFRAVITFVRSFLIED